MMFFSAALSLSLCTGALAGIHLDTTPSVQSTLTKLAIETTCPLLDVFEATSIAHQHSETCSQSHHHIPQNTTSNTISRTSNPWDIYPTCSQNTTTKFCVFTSTTFYNNRGISFLTKPHIARLISRFPAFTSKANPNPSSLSENDTRDPPFTVAPIPGKGMGMIASRTIERGELIKSHPAIAVFQNEAVDRSVAQYSTHFAPLMRLAVDQLPVSSRALFLNMAAHDASQEPYIERIYTNTFGEDFGGEEHSIVIPETARLNHDCRPNAMYYFDPKTFTHFTHAARTIRAGEEITITYVDPLQTRLRRRRAIKRSWGFNCSCSLCSQEGHFVAESNRRIGQINRLTNIFGDTGSVSKVVKGTTEMAELLVSLYEQERLSATVADGYRIAALSYAAVGQEWTATKWAMKAVEAGLINDGPGDVGLRDMKRLLGNVTSHWSWRINVGH